MELFKYRIKGIITKEHALLFQDWFLFLAKGRLEITGQGSSNDSWSLNLSSKETIKITFISNKNSIDILTPKHDSSIIEEISKTAFHRIENHTPTPGTWWSIGFHPEYSQQKTLTKLRYYTCLEVWVLLKEGQKNYAWHEMH